MENNKTESERDFHNRRFSADTDPRAHLDKWYASVRHGVEKQNRFVLDHAVNKDVLEYGCADGSLSLSEMKLPEICKSLTGIDISDVAIQKAVMRASVANFKNVNFLRMDAESTSFSDQSFDIVFGRGILHHLNLELCFREISRILRSNGVAIFTEPMGHNPVINLYRKRTPTLRTDDEHPLLVSDLDLACSYFDKVDTSFFGLFSVASVFFEKTSNGAPYRAFKALDDILLNIPAIGRYAWHCLIVCHKA